MRIGSCVLFGLGATIMFMKAILMKDILMKQEYLEPLTLIGFCFIIFVVLNYFFPDKPYKAMCEVAFQDGNLDVVYNKPCLVTR